MESEDLMRLLATAQRADESVKEARAAVDSAKQVLNKAEVASLNAWAAARREFDKWGLTEKLVNASK